jgi:MFS family permease
LPRRSLGRQFGWLWTAYAVSAYGSGIGFGAFPIIAVRVLHAGSVEVAALSATGLAVGAVIAVPLGPWIEFRRKRPVMMAMDLARFLALMTIPAAYALGWLSFAQLLVVSIIVSASKIAFTAASGANIKALVKPADLLVANSRFESTTWTALVVGPPLGGALVGLLGPVTTVIADAVSYLLSAAGIGAIRGREPRPARAGAPRLRAGDLLDGWRYILAHRALRRLLLNVILVNGLIMAASPLLAVLMLGRLRFAPWQFGLAFAVPCIGGLIGSRLARRLVARFGQHRVLRAAGALRACWPLALAFIRPGPAGLILVIGVEFALITCIGVFNPVLATYRFEQTDSGRTARVLSAWSVSTSVTIAALTALWGLLASITGPRAAIAIAGLLMLATPLLLPRGQKDALPRVDRMAKAGEPALGREVPAGPQRDSTWSSVPRRAPRRWRRHRRAVPGSGLGATLASAGGQPGADPADDGHSERGQRVLGVSVRAAGLVPREERWKLRGRPRQVYGADHGEQHAQYDQRDGHGDRRVTRGRRR